MFCAMAVVAFTGLTGVALAAGGDTSATLTGGELNISSQLTAGTFSGTLDGHAKVLDGSGFSGFSINDPRGTGVGWDVTMLATPLVNATVAGKDIVANSFTAPLFGVAKADTGSSDVPGTLHGAATIDTGAPASSWPPATPTARAWAPTTSPQTRPPGSSPSPPTSTPAPTTPP